MYVPTHQRVVTTAYQGGPLRSDIAKLHRQRGPGRLEGITGRRGGSLSAVPASPRQT